MWIVLCIIIIHLRLSHNIINKFRQKMSSFKLLSMTTFYFNIIFFLNLKLNNLSCNCCQALLNGLILQTTIKSRGELISLTVVGGLERGMFSMSCNYSSRSSGNKKGNRRNTVIITKSKYWVEHFDSLVLRIA